MRLGDRVVALLAFEECGFIQKSEWYTHAHQGEWGTVVDVFEHGGVMVRWDRTGSACDADESELIAPRAWNWCCSYTPSRPVA